MSKQMKKKSEKSIADDDFDVIHVGCGCDGGDLDGDFDDEYYNLKNLVK